MARVAPDETAFPARGHAFDLVLLTLWDDATDEARQIAWTREFYAAMQACTESDEASRTPHPVRDDVVSPRP